MMEGELMEPFSVYTNAQTARSKWKKDVLFCEAERGDRTMVRECGILDCDYKVISLQSAILVLDM